MLRLAAQAPSRRRPLSSNVRPRIRNIRAISQRSMATSQQIQEIISAVESGTIEHATKEMLAKYISWLAHPTSQGHFGGEQYSQVFEVVRLNMLRALIEAFEERSKVQQRWVMFFAVLAVAATLLPYLVAPKPWLGGGESSSTATAGASSPTPRATSAPARGPVAASAAMSLAK